MKPSHDITISVYRTLSHNSNKQHILFRRKICLNSPWAIALRQFKVFGNRYCLKPVAFVIILDFLIHQTATKCYFFCSLNNFVCYLLNNDVCLSVDLNSSVLSFRHQHFITKNTDLPTACNEQIDSKVFS